MLELFDLIWPRYGYGELRVVGGAMKPIEDKPPYSYAPRVEQLWFGLDDVRRASSLERIEEIAREYDNRGRDVYVGVLPRLVHGDGTARNCSSFSSILWADVDAKDHLPINEICGEEWRHIKGKANALRALLDFPVPASVVIDTGHGYHAYWKLLGAEAFGDCRKAMEGIARRVRGDSVYDQARIMRLPGLHNHKDGGKEPVRLLRLDATQKYSLHDFDEFKLVPLCTLTSLLPPDERPQWSRIAQDVGASPDATQDAGASHARASIPDRLSALIALDPGKGKRSEHVFRVARWLMELGYSDDEIEVIIGDHPDGVGVKFYERGVGWLDLTLRKARTSQWRIGSA